MPEAGRAGLPLSIDVSPRRVLVVVVAVCLLLVAAGWTVGVVSQVPGVPIPRRISRRLILTGEMNIAAWYSSLLLFVAALLLGVIALRERTRDGGSRSHWTVLSAVFLFLSMDESVALHELTPTLLEKLGLHAEWMVFGAGFVAVLALYLLPWILSLRPRTRVLVLVSAALFVGGALVLETASGFVDRSAGLGSIASISLAACEEMLEMLGSCLFIYALLDYLRAEGSLVEVRIE